MPLGFCLPVTQGDKSRQQKAMQIVEKYGDPTICHF